MEDTGKNIMFDKFDVIKVLKKDQHAAVYLAHHIYLGKKIILKVLNTESIVDKVITDRFKREAKILAQLDSVNIIKVLDFGMHKEFFYISFEYFPGQNLRSVINEKKLTNSQKEKLAAQFFKGLRVAHKNNIIHRDIKPDNILINESLDLKIGDFGLAEAVNESYVTSEYSLVGTPSYMSPEQISGKKLSVQSDLFSAGIVILELFTGSNPFLGRDINESINLITTFDESKISFDLTGLPEPVQNVIRNLLKRNPKDRSQNCDEVLESLGIEVDDVENIQRRPQRYPALNRKAIAAIALIVFIAIAAVIIFLSRDDSNNNEAVNNIGKAETADSIISEPDTSSIGENNRMDLAAAEGTNQENNISENRIENSDAGDQGINIKQNGELFVECLPWAEIHIDNTKYETTPMEKNITLPEGKYELKLIHPEYPAFVDSIQILPMETTTYKVNLDTLFGYLDCRVFPWGNIYVDSVLKGETPLLNPIVLAPDKYSVEIRNPQFQTVQKTVTISRGDTVKLVQNFNSGLN